LESGGHVHCGYYSRGQAGRPWRHKTAVNVAAHRRSGTATTNPNSLLRSSSWAGVFMSRPVLTTRLAYAALNSAIGVAATMKNRKLLRRVTGRLRRRAVLSVKHHSLSNRGHAVGFRRLERSRSAASLQCWRPAAAAGPAVDLQAATPDTFTRVPGCPESFIGAADADHVVAHEHGRGATLTSSIDSGTTYAPVLCPSSACSALGFGFAPCARAIM
jgi:hypothetical protein